jgi:Flp pilus assembly protein TadG
MVITLRCREERGSSLVEAAILLPFLVLMVFGIIEYGSIMSAYVTLRNASAVAARAAVLDAATATGIKQAAKDAISPMLDQSRLTDDRILIDTTKQVNGQNATEVKLSYDLPLVVPFIVPGHTGDHLTLTAATTMR